MGGRDRRPALGGPAPQEDPLETGGASAHASSPGPSCRFVPLVSWSQGIPIVGSRSGSSLVLLGAEFVPSGPCGPRTFSFKSWITGQGREMLL